MRKAMAKKVSGKKSIILVVRKRKARASKAKANVPRKGIKPAKVFIYALALAAFGGGGYLLYDKVKRKRALDTPDDTQDERTAITNPSASYAVTSQTNRPLADSFPLKKGSSGSRVMLLQQALAKIIGTLALNANGGVDGKFGKGTVNALKIAGYPATINEATFNTITGSGSGSNVTIIFNPSDIAMKLYQAAQSKNASGVIGQLKQVKTVSEYSSVNEYYKKQGFISKTIVTDLLDFAFDGNEDAKQQIRNEFLRIGLKSDISGKWSLQGIPLFNDLITIRETMVTDANNNRIPVRRNTILGDQIKIQSGMTWFKSIDHSILKVPTQDVKYV